MPDYAYDQKGMRLDGVTDNKPAAQAGLQQGDIIIELGGHDIENVQGYMKILSQFKKGDSTTIIYLRNGVKQESNVRF
jgi:S1-C subfamily serine protease